MFNNILKSSLILFVLVYSMAFVYTLQSPHTIEKDATEFIKKEIEKRTNEKIDTLSQKYENNKLVKLSKKFYDKENEQLKLYQEALKQKVHEKMTAVVAKMQKWDCECREKYGEFVKGIFDAQVKKLSESVNKLQEFMQYQYMNVVQNLLNDFRIFTGSNLLVVVMLLLLMLIKPQANLQIGLLVGFTALSTLVTSYLYIFEQNWFFTIIYNDFIGYAYLAYLGVIFFFLWDIIFNKARITTEIVNAILNVIGSSFSAVSC